MKILLCKHCHRTIHKYSTNDFYYHSNDAKQECYNNGDTIAEPETNEMVLSFTAGYNSALSDVFDFTSTIMLSQSAAIKKFKESALKDRK